MNELNTNEVSLPDPSSNSVGTELNPESEAVKLFSSFAMLASMKSAGVCKQMTQVVDRQVRMVNTDPGDLS